MKKAVPFFIKKSWVTFMLLLATVVFLSACVSSYPKHQKSPIALKADGKYKKR